MDYFDHDQLPSDTGTSASTALCTPSATPIQIKVKPESPSIRQESTPVVTPTGSDSTEDEPVVSISTTFHAQANIGGVPSDLIIVSTDKVFFYVHRQRLTNASINDFNDLLPSYATEPEKRHPLVITVDVPAAIINVVLHTLYGMSCEQFHPSLDILSAAIDATTAFGLPLREYVVPHQPLYKLLLAQAPYNPINFFALAAAHEFEELAVAISPHLLSFNLSSLTDELVERMGAVYLRRLFFMHRGRLEALKRLLLRPPEPHAPAASCGPVQQAKLTRGWALAAAQLAWDARPDLSVHAIRSALAPLMQQLTCEQCKDVLNARVEQLSADWIAIKITI